MTESDATKTEVTLLCPECRDLIEVADPRAVLLAAHLDNHCPETAGILHP